MEIPQIQIHDAKQKLDQKESLFVDIRDPGSYGQAHIPGAIHLHDGNVQEFLQNVTRYNHRHALKVGITGWAQVNGWRGDTSIEKRVEYDLYYLQNWSLGLDLRIIALTALSVVIQRNAY